MSEPERTDILLEKYLKKYGLYKDYKRREIIIKWDKVVNREFFYLVPLFFEKDVLICKINNISYIGELEKKRGELLKRINKYLGDEYSINDIRIIKV